MTTAAEAPDRVSPDVWRISVVVIVGAVMSLLDMTIVNVALDTQSRDLHSSLSDIQWVVTAYMLALAAVIPVTGWAAEKVGRAPALDRLGDPVHARISAVRGRLVDRVADRLPRPAGVRRRDDHAGRPDGAGRRRRAAADGPRDERDRGPDDPPATSPARRRS